MEKIKEYKGILIIILILIIGTFYWFQLRPNSIRKGCWNEIEKIKNGEIKKEGFNSEQYRINEGIQNSIDKYYENCLRKRGLD